MLPCSKFPSTCCQFIRNFTYNSCLVLLPTLYKEFYTNLSVMLTISSKKHHRGGRISGAEVYGIDFLAVPPKTSFYFFFYNYYKCQIIRNTLLKYKVQICFKTRRKLLWIICALGILCHSLFFYVESLRLQAT